MKYLKLFESDEWRRKTNDKELYDLSLEIDDILIDISDDGFPYVQPSHIHKEKISIEIVHTPDGTLSYSDGLQITPTVKSTLERLTEYVESKGYKIDIRLYLYPNGNSGSCMVVYIKIKGDKWISYKEVDVSNYGDLEEVTSIKLKQVDPSIYNPEFIGIRIEKKLKTYEVFDLSAILNTRDYNLTGDDIDNIKDICLDITDEGFGVSIHSEGKGIMYEIIYTK